LPSTYCSSFTSPSKIASSSKLNCYSCTTPTPTTRIFLSRLASHSLSSRVERSDRAMGENWGLEVHREETSVRF
jgi:hypothetical protein